MADEEIEGAGGSDIVYKVLICYEKEKDDE